MGWGSGWSAWSATHHHHNNDTEYFPVSCRERVLRGSHLSQVRDKQVAVWSPRGRAGPFARGAASGGGSGQSAPREGASGWHGASWAAGQRPSSLGTFKISKRGKVLTSGPAGGFCQRQQLCVLTQPVWSSPAGERLYNPRQCSETVRPRLPPVKAQADWFYGLCAGFLTWSVRGFFKPAHFELMPADSFLFVI